MNMTTFVFVLAARSAVWIAGKPASNVRRVIFGVVMSAPGRSHLYILVAQFHSTSHGRQAFSWPLVATKPAPCAQSRKPILIFIAVSMASTAQTLLFPVPAIQSFWGQRARTIRIGPLGDDVRISPAEPFLETEPLTDTASQRQNHLRHVLAVIPAESLEIHAQGRALRTGAGETHYHTRSIFEQDPDTRVRCYAVVHGIDIAELVGHRDAAVAKLLTGQP